MKLNTKTLNRIACNMTTLSILKLGVMTLSIATLNIMTLTLATLGKTKKCNTQHDIRERVLML